MKKSALIFFVAMFLLMLTGCSVLGVKTSNGIVPFLFPSAGTTVGTDGEIHFSTSVEDNRFNSVVLQLYSDSPVTHLLNITSCTDGKQSGVYTHEYDTGDFIMTLKANSNLRDEAVNLKIHLVKGNSYVYSFNVKTFNEKEVTITDFAFGMK